LREKGVEVIALTREDTNTSMLKSIDVETINGDVRDFASIERALIRMQPDISSCR
jgi:nucleoside-diphosphate-sugar epimerase